MTTEIIIIGQQKKSIFPPKIQQILNFPSLIAFFTSPVWVPILYSIGYLFLYGFYFSPSLVNNDDPSKIYFTPLFDVIRNPVPFNFYTVILSTTFFLILTVWMYLIVLVLKKYKEHFPFLLLLPLILYYLLQTVFSGTLEFSVDNLLFVLIFLIIPLMLISFTLILNKLFQNIYSALAGVLWGFMAPLLLLVVAKNLYTYAMALYIFLAAILIISFNQLFKKSKEYRLAYYLYKFIVVFPIVTILNTLIIWMLNVTLLHFEQSMMFFGIIVMLSVLISLWITYQTLFNDSLFMKNTPLLDDLKNTSLPHSFIDTLENAYLLFKRDRESFFVFLGITIFVIFTFLAIMATVVLNVGAITYDNMPERSQFLQQQDTISILSTDSNDPNITKTYIGKIIAMKDGILYISDQNRNLVIIKSDDFIIEPTTVKTEK